MISWMMGPALVLLALTSRLSSLSSEHRGGRWSGMSRTSSMVSALYKARRHASYLSVGSCPSHSSDTPPPSAWQNLLEKGDLALVECKKRADTFIYWLLSSSGPGPGPRSGPKGPRTKDQRPEPGLTLNLVCHHHPPPTTSKLFLGR